MRIPRIYYPKNIKSNSLINLSLASSNHLKVVRLKEGHQVEIFNGRGCVTSGEIQNIKSPKGTTEAGINSLEINSFDKIIYEAIESAVERSIEISKAMENE